MADLLQRIEQNIQSRRLLKRGQKILVAVSGGLDSMTLLHTLHKISTRFKWKIVVAHFNHQLRSERFPFGAAFGAPAAGTAGRLAGKARSARDRVQFVRQLRAIFPVK